MMQILLAKLIFVPVWTVMHISKFNLMKITGNKTLNTRISGFLNKLDLLMQALIIKVPAYPILVDQIRNSFSTQL